MQCQALGLHFCDEEEGTAQEEVNAVRDKVIIRVAIDSGAVKNVTHPSTIPGGVTVAPNVSGKHFSGAGGESMERFEGCTSHAK